MTGSEYLHEVKLIRRRIRLLQEQIDRDTVLASGVGAIRYDKVSVQTSPVADRMADIVARIIETTDDLKKEIRALQTKECETRHLLLQLSEKYERVLSLHYFDNLSWCMVAEKMGYDETYVYDLKNRALDELTKLLNKS